MLPFGVMTATLMSPSSGRFSKESTYSSTVSVALRYSKRTSTAGAATFGKMVTAATAAAVAAVRERNKECREPAADLGADSGWRE